MFKRRPTPDARYIETDDFRFLEMRIPESARNSPETEKSFSIRVMIEQKMKLHQNGLSDELPDGRKALVLDAIPGSRPSTFTILAEVRRGGVRRPSIMAAVRDDDGQATDSCTFDLALSTFQHPFTDQEFNGTFGFEGNVLKEIQLDQFYYPIIEGNPLDRSQSDRILISDLKAGLI